MEEPIKAGQKAYTVLKIDELMRVGDMGTLEKYYRSTIKTKGGTVLTIDISEKNFTAALAIPILTAHAQEADKIRSS